MNSVLCVSHLPYDPVLEKARGKMKKGNPLGEIAIGPKNVMMSKAYADWADKIYNMEIRTDDIWIVSIPRSGTTWTEEMTWLLCNNLDYERAKKDDLHKRFTFLEFAARKNVEKLTTEFGALETIINAESPRYIKTHLPLQLLPTQLWTVKPKIIYVYRNPKDVAISQYHFARMMNGYEGSLEEWAEIFLQDKRIYSPFWSHVLDFWELQKEQDVLFLIYEEMKQDLLSNVYKVADYLGKKLTEDQAKKLCEHLDFDTMKNNSSVNQKKQLTEFKVVSKPEDVNFIRKGRSGQWRDNMTREMIEAFDQWSKKYIDETDFNFYD